MLHPKGARILLLALSVAALACAPAREAPPAASTASGAPTWQAQWDSTLAAAKREGKVVVAGVAGEDMRRALTESFERKYGIEVEYQGSSGSEIPPRVEKERAAGIYAWDAFVAGTTTLVHGLKPLGALDPIEPALILPEVTEPQGWRNGQVPYFDKDRLGASLTLVNRQSLFINTDLAKPEEFTSWRALLDPKWKGRIVVGRDPRISGYSQAVFQHFYMHPELGPDFIRELLKQDLEVLRDLRLAAQWLGQGKHPICICNYVEANRLIEARLPVQAVDPRQMKEGAHVTSSNGNIALANRAPHPNAARIYVNWVLSQEGGTLFSRASGDPSQRLDVPIDHVQAWELPQPGWIATHTEEALAQKEQLEAFLHAAMGR
jgi:iron(III) transport system substrate-binding protein